MSITVPTAQERPGSTPPRPPGGRGVGVGRTLGSHRRTGIGDVRAFVRSVPGPRGYAVITEGGRPVLYRWDGLS
ncbi:MAG: hypothetical protein WD990_08875 [Acidimicrobiia bacterium]